MHTSLFTTQAIADGIVERDFLIDDVPGVLWSPESASPGTPLVLMGHGGGLHKRSARLVGRARDAVLHDGFAVAAIDAPGHGDRPRSTEDQRWVEAMFADRAAGRSMASTIAAYNASLADRAVPEWRATIDALTRLPEIGDGGPIGYSGMTLASAIGIPLAAVDPRITAAIFGGVFVYDELIRAARQVSIPIEFLLPWDDDEIDRDSGLTLFGEFGSLDKTLHAFPGSHFTVPVDRIDTRFFVRHLRGGGAAAA
ncbi:alpha/beta hydrolase [Jongsikchunia kroppenstedtii]|uniref:alpha/beta hydrolase n=1 Tax=Jongsikchunia kroppenstedtii TaxID=1121721 RepID=UPI0003793A80|nr:alpha/beta hydrolase [Jongsikchunia kroppenstedtii]